MGHNGGNKGTLIPAFLAVFASSCAVYCSLGFKRYPHAIWVSMWWNGLLLCCLYPLQPIFKSNNKNLSPKGHETRRGGGGLRGIGWTTAAVLFVEVTAGCVHVVTQYLVLRYLNLGDAMVLANGLQLFGMIVGEFIALSRRPSVVSIISSVLILFGVFLVAKPPIVYQYLDSSSHAVSGNGDSKFDLDYLIGTLLCGVASLCGNVYYLLLARLPHLSETFHVGCMGAVLLIPCTALHLYADISDTISSLVPCGVVAKLLVFSFGLSQCSGHFAAVVSSQQSSPLFSLIVRLVVIPIGYIAQVLYLGESILTSSLIGATIIVGAICLQSGYTILAQKRQLRKALKQMNLNLQKNQQDEAIEMKTHDDSDRKNIETET
ncbi:uncharacterized protein LOC134845971 [Symsagittifera roscoffensis]|uniref:uncharacterized protein LOC134845971 n=1 Tax=Symsagittifera roscoffensis TaxID=84072 RepID=UPI00307CC38C